MSKFSMLVAGSVGYVLGARAGRRRYEQIASQAQRVWSNPKVQKVTSDAQEVAREKAPLVTEKLGEASKAAMGAVASKVGRNGDHTEQPPVATPPVEAVPPIIVTDDVVADEALTSESLADEAAIDDAPAVVVEDTSPYSESRSDSTP